MHADVKSSTDDIKTQLLLAIQNLEQVITAAGYECKIIVRLTVYSTSTAELRPHVSILQGWIAEHEIQ